MLPWKWKAEAVHTAWRCEAIWFFFGLRSIFWTAVSFCGDSLGPRIPLRRRNSSFTRLPKCQPRPKSNSSERVSRIRPTIKNLKSVTLKALQTQGLKWYEYHCRSSLLDHSRPWPLTRENHFRPWASSFMNSYGKKNLQHLARMRQPSRTQEKIGAFHFRPWKT